MAKGKRGGSRTNVGGKIVCKLPSNFVCAQKITLSAVGLYKEVKEAIMGWLNVSQECDLGIQEQQIMIFQWNLQFNLSYLMSVVVLWW